MPLEVGMDDDKLQVETKLTGRVKFSLLNVERPFRSQTITDLQNLQLHLINKFVSLASRASLFPFIMLSLRPYSRVFISCKLFSSC